MLVARAEGVRWVFGIGWLSGMGRGGWDRESLEWVGWVGLGAKQLGKTKGVNERGELSKKRPSGVVYSQTRSLSALLFGSLSPSESPCAVAVCPCSASSALRKSIGTRGEERLERSANKHEFRSEMKLQSHLARPHAQGGGGGGGDGG